MPSTAAFDYEWLFDHSPLCALVHDPHHGTVIAGNRAAARALGYPQAELAGMPLNKLMGESGLYRSERAIERMILVVEKGIETAQWRLIRRSGEQFPIETTAIPLHDSDGRLLMVVQFRDISEEFEAQRREERYRRLLADSFGGTMIADVHGRVRYVAPSVTRILGYSERDLIGSDFRKLIHSDDRVRVHRQIGMLVASGDTGLHDVEYRVLHADGEYRYLEAGLRNRASHELVGGLLLSFCDVTARVVAEQDARQRRDEMQALLRFRTMAELGSAIAHELNQPVAAIRNYAAGCLKVIPEDDAGAKVSWAIRKIEQEAERAARIMRSIRNFTTEGRTERRMQPLRDIFADVEALTSVRAQEHGAIIKFPTLPKSLKAWCDKTLTEQVMVNLILNALHAIQGEDVEDRTIEVSAHALDTEFVEIVVRDRGRGMTPDQLDALFQARRSTRESFGLGLILSRSIVTNHGGQIWARSAIHEGTAMFFTLRRRPEKHFVTPPVAIQGHG